MTLTQIPTDPRETLAHMGPDALLAHMRAAYAELTRYGVAFTPAAACGLDEIEECVVEHLGRTDRRALNAHLARAQGGLCASAA